MNKNNCQQCHREFTPTNRRGPIPKFCSNACRQAHYRGTSSETYQLSKRQKTRNAIAQAEDCRPKKIKLTETEKLLARGERLLAESKALRLRLGGL